MTAWIMGPRGSGRSTRLVEMAAAGDLLIVTADRFRADALAKMAEEMGEEIRHPEPFYAWMRQPHRFFDYKMRHPGILLDDADSILECVLRFKVVCAVAQCDGGPCRNADEGAAAFADAPTQETAREPMQPPTFELGA